MKLLHPTPLQNRIHICPRIGLFKTYYQFIQTTKSNSTISESNKKRPVKRTFLKKNLVEAMGVEPMSALLQTPSATCLAFTYTHSATQKATSNTDEPV